MNQVTYQVVLGAHDISNLDESDKRDLENIINHEGYTTDRYGYVHNDINILVLKDEVRFGPDIPNIRPACLPTEDQNNLDGKTATISGWGDMEEGARVGSPVLMSTELRIISNSECSNTYPTIRDYKVCAIGEDKDTCQGDSGGPLTTVIKGRYVLVGVVSYGNGCARKGVPGVYARVHAYRDWLKKHLGDAKTCPQL